MTGTSAFHPVSSTNAVSSDAVVTRGLAAHSQAHAQHVPAAAQVSSAVQQRKR